VPEKTEFPVLIAPAVPQWPINNRWYSSKSMGQD